ncbi:glycosyltransferase involved in cell wall biosynthesis [Dysgonomonas sp. PH5-45]|uniref:glycogen/starch synthase n=1 Tax=unclassified Dysgonomonas TaxID=2630389 RepID=UPI0024752E3C|nr:MULTISPECIES: glycogen/starch synthase [unclassified Dysgonomonas]MDH6355590.1 glycosyltransferase involved in cell wall biosynthesis [Dysgonomonas sp. PH5-45]MDH6388500.1 glycosyltransferase involved in cell wall biosynthesis [Dysgonomonas sp. PH5-37]
MTKKQVKNELLIPDYVFEASWEVCNKMGGIYTVLSSKAKTMQTIYNGNVLFVGPDVWKTDESPWFVEDKKLFADWIKTAKKADGLKIRCGYWDVPGQPKAVLVDFQSFFDKKDDFYTHMWNTFKVDSLHAYGDYDESCMFAYAAASAIESFYNFYRLENKNVVVHFDEWMLGMGLLYVKDRLPKVATVFTTHATTVGRSICSNNKPLYGQLKAYNGDQMSHELNVVSRHSVEKAAAHEADCFTTVSGVTAMECEQLLRCKPEITPNGFEKDFVPTGRAYTTKRNRARKALIGMTEKLTGQKIDKDCLLIATSGRYEYRNKGIDVFIDALNRVKYLHKLEKQVIAFIMVPAWVDSPREDLKTRLKSKTDYTTPLPNPFITHNIHNMDNDQIVSQLRWLKLDEVQSRVKIVFVPSYLNGADGILNMDYYDLLIGMDATFFPSYYEPWGYTPHESIAFSVPTLTTSLSGFGVWAKQIDDCSSIASGIRVTTRNDDNFVHVAIRICDAICQLSAMPPERVAEMRKKATDKAAIADWGHFYRHYSDAYSKALHKAKAR